MKMWVTAIEIRKIAKVDEGKYFNNIPEDENKIIASKFI